LVLNRLFSKNLFSKGGVTMVLYNYTVGSASASPYSNSTYLNDYWTDDIYSFSVSEKSSINLNLHNITAGDDADLYLYQDDGDGVFELNQDTRLASSRRGGNSDDSINYLVESGNYFARVERYAPGSQGSLDYELDLSATPDTPYPANDPTEAPNLLPKEFELGQINLAGGSTNWNQTITRTDWVGDSDTADTYHFSVSDYIGEAVALDVSLTGLSSDADIRLIRDRDGDQIVDLNEVIDSSTLGSTSNESFRSILQNVINEDFFVQVYQYSGDTSYDLNMTLKSILL
jgi:hypothetical protein